MSEGGTVFAPATAPGRAGVAVVRLSGPGARGAAEALAGPLPPAGRALRTLRHGGEALDRALVLTWARPASFTGEDVAELHLHGAPAVVAAVLAALGAMPGLRLAEPGEFARRALGNGKLALPEVEGLAALLDAETEGQRRQAMRLMSGALGAKAEGWRARLLRAAALAEATIDFADEEVPQDVWPEVRGLVAGVAAELAAEAAGARAAARLARGYEVAIVGPPNAGKSTLLNRLAGREAALVSPEAGTTRDVVEARLDLGGLPVALLDTAGDRKATGVEAMGVARGRERAARADLRVHLVPPGAPAPRPGPDDLVLPALDDDGRRGGVSGLTGAGVDALLADLARRLAARAQPGAVAIGERQARAMIEGAEALAEAARRIDAGEPPEIAAAALRRALSALDALVGRVGAEDVLGEVFARFCIGK